MKIGVFDSGVGGKNIVNALVTFFPDDEVIYANDQKNVPYGSKQPDEIQKLTLAAVFSLVSQGCQIIVIACNTATTNAIEVLRKAHPTVLFVGLEPMIKPAAQLTKTGTIAVCATPATLRSPSYLTLKHTWANEINVIEPDCSTWARLIEKNRASEVDVEALVQELATRQCDVIVLACTHYHWLKERFLRAAKKEMRILEPTDAIAERVAHLKEDYRLFTAATN